LLHASKEAAIRPVLDTKWETLERIRLIRMATRDKTSSRVEV